VAFYRREKSSGYRVRLESPIGGDARARDPCSCVHGDLRVHRVLRNDLKVSLSKSGPGVHLHGYLAWICFTGMMMMSMGVVRFLSPPYVDGRFAFDERRRVSGPIFFIGLVLYGASQSMAGPRLRSRCKDWI